MALKVGIVGLRGIGNRHAGCHVADSLSELVAVCDIVKERADAAAERHGVKAYYTLSDMLKHEDLDVEYQGETLTVGFDARYFLDLLNEIDEERVILELSGELDPGLLRPDDSQSYLGVVMPMRL